MRRLFGGTACLMAVTLAGVFSCVVATASDWPRFRGPNGSGICADTEPLPAKWSADENLQWKTELPGAGVSCPIVVGERVFVTCYSGYGLDRRDVGEMRDLKRHLVCVNRADGKILWKSTVDAKLPEDPYSGAGVPEHGYASHTPVSDGKRVYCFFGKSGVFAYDMDGKQVWQHDVGNGSDRRRWGSSSSPIVYKNIVIVPAAAESESLVGINAETGKELWREKAGGFDGLWGTPILVEIEENRTDMVLGVPYEVWGFNPETGRLRWYCEAMSTDQYNSSVVAEDGVVFGIEGRSGGSIALKAGGKDDITKSAVVWSGRDAGRFTTPVVHKGRLFSFARGVFSVLDTKTGENVHRGRLDDSGAADNGAGGRRGGSDYSSPIMADGKLYYTTRNGNCYVFEADGDYKQLAVNRVTKDNEDFSATPAASHGQLFLRSNKALYCVSAAKEKTTSEKTE